MTQNISQDRSIFNVTEYLERIDCPLDVNPSPSYLKKLHVQHLIHIPFENMDNFLGNQIMLDLDRLYKKIVLKNRGGFCYELNGLFYHLLLKLGFNVNMISARVYDKNGSLRPVFDHMALIVDFEKEKYLVDVGFGDFFRQPKKMVMNEVQMDNNRFFKLDKNIDDEYSIAWSANALDFKKEYQFTLQPRGLVEFVEMCDFHHRNKDSHLVRNRYITQSMKDGQKTLTRKKLNITRLGKTEETEIQNLDDFKVKLYEHFGIKYRINR